jgi:hypothetical protein
MHRKYYEVLTYKEILVHGYSQRDVSIATNYGWMAGFDTR